MQGRIGVAQAYPASGPAGGELESGQYVDGGQSGRTETRDIADHDIGAGGLQFHAHVLAQSGHVITGEGAGQHEYGGCHGVHER